MATSKRTSVTKLIGKRRRSASQKLTIYLLKKEFDEKSALRTASSVKATPVTIGGDRGWLVVPSRPSARPRWATFVDQIAGRKVNAETKSASALLLLRRKGRVFAVTFGHARGLLMQSCWEERFGLIVALNAIPTNGVRSTDFQSFDAAPSHRHAQGVGEGSFADFGLDTERDLVRAAVGKPGDPSLGSKMSGGDSLQVHVSITPAELGDLLERYLKLSRDEQYKEKYPWIDRLAAVKDVGLVDRLDEKVLSRIKDGDRERLWLALPERVELGDVAGFKYTQGEREGVSADIHLDNFLSHVRNIDGLSIKSLKQRHVYAVAESSEAVLDSWSVYKCLYAEERENGALFVLTGGKWYRVEEDFANAVENSVRSIKRRTGRLPSFSNVRDKSEKTYLINASKNDAALALMDRKLIRMRGLSPIELCDLFSDQKQFVHVKRYGGSAVLSHLFSQGAIAGQLFARHQEFRELAKAKMPVSHQALVPGTYPAGFEVVFGIVSQSEKRSGTHFRSSVN